MQRKNGFLLVTVLIVMVVIGLLVLATSFTALADRRVAASQRGGTEAFYLAQAGIERLKTGAFLTLANEIMSADPAACEMFGGGGLDLGDGLVLFPENPATITYGPGAYTLSYSIDGNRFILTAVGVIGASRSTVQVVATAGGGPAGVWDNAVYARVFQRTQGNNTTLTGRIAAYGSVHIVNGDIAVDDGTGTFDVTGTAGMFNNYNGRGQQTSRMTEAVKALGSVNSQVPDLCARLKVAQGDVLLQGAAQIGAAEISGSTFVNRADGLYLGAGVVRPANSTTPIAPDDLESNGVHTRLGVNGYDGFDLSFPPLDPAFPNELAPGEQSILTTLNCPLIREEGQGANRRTALFLPPSDPGTPVTCGTADHFIEWDAAAGHLVISGNVTVPNDNVVINSTLTYSGTGVLRVGTKGAASVKGVEINGQLLPANPATYVAKDGSATGLGIVTAGNVTIGGNPGSNPTIAAMIYSEQTIEVNQSYTVVGALVGNSVATNQVPAILYHPGVRDMAEELCLPGSRCAEDGEFGNAGQFRDISVERR